MNEEDKTMRRGWCIDYALRLQPKEATPEQIIEAARKFEQYMMGTQPANVLSLAKSDKK